MIPNERRKRYKIMYFRDSKFLKKFSSIIVNIRGAQNYCNFAHQSKHLYRVHEVLVFDIVKKVVNIINFIPKKKLKATD